MQNAMIQGASLIDNLQQAAPLWPLGVEESGLRRVLVKALAEHSAALAPCGPTAVSVALWNWQQSPLSMDAVLLLSEFAAQVPVLTEPCRRLLQTLRSELSPDKAPPRVETGALINELESGNHATALRFLLPRLTSPQGLHWLGAAFEPLLRLGSADPVRAVIDQFPWSDGLAPLRLRLEAQCATLYSPPPQALEPVTRLDDDIWPGWKLYMASELFLRAGETRQGTAMLGRLWRAMPWHIGMGLKLRTLLHPAPDATASVREGKACVLLYSWNKADLVDQTLSSFMHSGADGARLFVLDNGSTDHMQEVLSRWRQALGPDRMHVTTLPVNIGAPAARNWLLSLPEVRAHDWAAFLDDDVILPHGWLERLLANALHSSEEVGTVGCRIISASAPDCLQSADYNIFPPQPGTKTFRDMEENLLVHDNCAGSLDYGLFGYTRPALSVSGCCHLLNLRAVDRVGDFDIRFSPTQFDDLERDLRTATAGLRTVYAGELAIRHVQHSSLAKAQSPTSMAQVFGNKIKLEGKYDRKTLDSLSKKMLASLWDDAKSCWTMLDRELPRD